MSARRLNILCHRLVRSLASGATFRLEAGALFDFDLLDASMPAFNFFA
jgi:hypothetical protein